MRFCKLFLSLIVLLLVLTFAAQAERTQHLVYPTEKPLYDTETLRLMREALQNTDLSAAGGLIASFEQIGGSDNYFEPTTWQLNVEGGSGSYQYVLEVLRSDEHFIDINKQNYDHIITMPRSNVNTITFDVVASGSYVLRGFVFDSTGDIAFIDLPLEAMDEAYPTVDQVLENIVNQCPAGDDFERAVWLHDWITHHAHYDTDLVHRGVDGVLMRHTGVCDSYAKCYMCMLQLAGIDCVRVTGTGNGGSHAWNAVKFGGDWYWVDTTWDDPTTGTEADHNDESGYEGHMFFGLPDEVFFCDHAPEDSDIHCTSYDYNYYIHTGDNDLSIWTRDFIAAINESLSSGQYASDTPVKYWYREDYEGGYSIISIPQVNDMLPFGLAAEALRRMDWYADGQAVRMNIDYSPTNIHAEIDFTGRELKLPADLTDVEEAAFESDAGFMSVTLSDATQTVGPNSFADADALWRVIVPNANTVIDDSAFDDSYHLTLVGPAGGTAEAYANAHGLHFIAE